MGEREEDPRDERPPVDVRLLRPRDLIDLRLEAPGCTIEPTDGGAELVAGPEASLVVHFPPQHLGEEVWQAGAPPPPVAPPTRPSGHVAAGPTRSSTRWPRALASPTRWKGCSRRSSMLPLRVSPNATAAGEPTREERGPELPADLETAIEAPYRLIVSPSVARRVPALDRNPSGHPTAPSCGAPT